MGVRGEQLPADSEAPPSLVGDHSDPASPSLATLRTQGRLLQAAQQPRPEEPALGAWSSGGGGEPVAMAEPGCLRVTATAYPRGPGHSGIQISRSHLGCSSHGALSPGHRAAQLPVWPCSGLGIVLGSPMGWRLERACTSLPGQTGPWGG